MISEKMHEQVKNSSVIRAMFEEGKRLAGIYGAENVFDFSLGNPNVEPPEEVKKAILEIVNDKNDIGIHGYMNNSGYEEVRAAIAKSINDKFGTTITHNSILMTVGAAGGLNVILKTLLNPKDEVITFAPFFGEYRNYVKNFDGELIAVSPNTIDFQPNLKEFKDKITPKTKAVIINSPNNPTGVIYSEETIIKLSEILREKQKEFSTDIYLIADEPYRELAYDQAEVPYLSKYYANTIVGYSYSKSLSLPGERIGYLMISDQATDFENIISAANIANRILGFVNAPALFQRVIVKCLDAKVDLEAYNRNRELLYKELLSYGYQCIKPEGAFYMFVKSPIENDAEFCSLANKKNILIVPGSAFGCPGYVRIAYCVAYETIVKALPGFKALIEELK
ncbi:pyridoxal phosphate-dependent aminotransferase [Desulfosporosinus nitroreducens]|uniref:Aminotransferase n=1 Tax=Desulfosporosinus nitroreducens TaxID=2018668 RepID=A0ABT8QZD2_9FIRM|nr:pyridoxal phosphate-dependent aminotransferase [Desulfosporosinus nitroreducens]MCO1603520.1 pyridoxal phosphate-dependent aminotransferase [Desulfosporosinus nitroreducens]MDO0825914.1 pyridoxal phosphate-dependent aminotransferase [Desulfosporosinus nitroreducens]